MNQNVNDLVAGAVLAAKERGIILQIAAAAEKLARVAGRPDAAREIADALLREGIRLRVAMQIDSPRPFA
ncbi:MAG TPA: hypothetical protein VHG92_13605 [Afifellaceae bacterium]|nr:hypothetical protein [Afifellaceae bacterium]